MARQAILEVHYREREQFSELNEKKVQAPETPLENLNPCKGSKHKITLIFIAQLIPYGWAYHP